MTQYAVGIEDLFWEEADNEDDAIEAARERLKGLSDEDIEALDLTVVDGVE